MASESETMLPCPFCGGTGVGEEYHETYSVDSSYWTFECDHCGVGWVGRDTKENRAAWNHRAPSAEAKDAPVTITAAMEDAGLQHVEDMRGLSKQLRRNRMAKAFEAMSAIAHQGAAAAQESCESAQPECGPVAHHDEHGVPLCDGCWAQVCAEGSDAEAQEVGRG